jgi:hypothetical protein
MANGYPVGLIRSEQVHRLPQAGPRARNGAQGEALPTKIERANQNARKIQHPKKRNI